jgi:hypothetical protein
MNDYVLLGNDVTDEDQSVELRKAGLDLSIADHTWRVVYYDRKLDIADWEVEKVEYRQSEFIIQAMGKDPTESIHPAWSLLSLMSWVATKGEWTLTSSGTLKFRHNDPGMSGITLENTESDLLNLFVQLTLKLLKK